MDKLIKLIMGIKIRYLFNQEVLLIDKFQESLFLDIKDLILHKMSMVKKKK